MGKEGKRLKRCSTSTDVEVDHAKPSQKAKRKLDTLDTKVDRKKKKKSENKQSDLEPKLKQKKKKKKSENKQIDEDDLGNNLEQKTQENKSENKAMETHPLPWVAKVIESWNWRTSISIRGYDPSLSLDDIKSALTQHFGSCGKMTRFYVDIKNGFVHIDMNSEAAKKALTLNGSLLGGRSLEVRMARDTDEYDPIFVIRRNAEAFADTCGGRYLPSRLVKAFKTNTNTL